MGKGKGKLSAWVSPIVSGRLLIYVNFASLKYLPLVKGALRRTMHRLSPAVRLLWLRDFYK